MSSVNEKSGDRRIRRTKRIFKTHFISLIREKGYKNVTVTDIVGRADYNRSTFYLYFKDKEDLAEELVTEVLDELNKSFRRPFEDTMIVDYKLILPTSNTFFQHIYEHKYFYGLLKLEDTIPGFREKFLNKFKEIFYAITYINNENKEINLDHFNTYKMYGSYGVLLEWIEGGCIKSPEEIAENLLEIFKTKEILFKLK
ncbi:TetR/AcrR family transcriptional regulator [Psychrobacillus sp. FJAT-51614]|uniref:TetR/AcrR family transcriptional regulator n=2 Tax=Psychrobacillus mangrovi TaxID=3117745 RepID=A0ABU8F8W6_9BACI